LYGRLANRFSNDEAGQTVNDQQLIDYLRDECNTLRDEIKLLRKQEQRLEESRETWKALSEAWQCLAELRANGNA
jgi:molybdopterin-guanine dinucleotide biosynthesis protein A